MILFYPGLVSCIYIFHRSTGKFLGEPSSPDINDKLFPIMNVSADEAIDWTQTTPGREEGDAKSVESLRFSSSSDLNPIFGYGKALTFKAKYIDEGDQNKEKVVMKAFDIDQGPVYGLNQRLLSFLYHGRWNQIFSLVLTASGSFNIVNGDRCVTWNARRLLYDLQSCRDAPLKEFDIYVKKDYYHDQVIDLTYLLFLDRKTFSALLDSYSEPAPPGFDFPQDIRDYDLIPMDEDSQVDIQIDEFNDNNTVVDINGDEEICVEVNPKNCYRRRPILDTSLNPQ